MALNNVKPTNLEKQIEAFVSANEPKRLRLLLFRQEQLLSFILKPTASVANVLIWFLQMLTFANYFELSMRDLDENE